MNFLSHLECSKCGTQHSPLRPQNLCSRCSGPLLVRYHLVGARETFSRSVIASRAASMWRYRELLPVQDEANVVSLGEGFTPLVATPRLGDHLGLARLLVKDESLNPTGTFKARGASAGVSRAKELSIRDVAMATAGNAGGAWAAYGARAGLVTHIAMPHDAPEANKAECRMYGAHLEFVHGLISDAGALITRGVREYGWFDVSTLREPYRIEGKKTMGLEISEQLGWRLPDAVIYPAGGGVGIIGIAKAFAELAELGWVEAKRVRYVVVQAEGCAPLVEAFEHGRPESRFWENATTLAAGLRVPKALGDFLVLRSLAESGGAALAVSDAHIVESMALAARMEGMLMCPEGAATVAAAQGLRASGWLDAGDEVVLINTGTGLKYPDALKMAAESGA